MEILKKNNERKFYCKNIKWVIISVFVIEKQGLTCMCNSIASSSISDLPSNALSSGFDDLFNKLCRYLPSVLCFNGKGIYEGIADKIDSKNQELGLKPQPRGNYISMGLQKQYLLVKNGTETKKIMLFVVPSSSARVKAYNYQQKLQFFIQLKELLNKL